MLQNIVDLRLHKTVMHARPPNHSRLVSTLNYSFLFHNKTKIKAPSKRTLQR
jgi:hypothetical protein